MEDSTDFDKTCQGRIFGERDLSLVNRFICDEKDLDNLDTSAQFNENIEEHKSKNTANVTSLFIQNFQIDESKEDYYFIQSLYPDKIKSNEEDVHNDIENLFSQSNELVLQTNEKKEEICGNNTKNSNIIVTHEGITSIKKIDVNLLNLRVQVTDDIQDNINLEQNVITVVSTEIIQTDAVFLTLNLQGEVKNQKSIDNQNIQILQLPQFNQLPSISSHSLSQIPQQQKELILNYEKAANIINSIFNKSMNHVQRINKHVNTFIEQLKQRSRDRQLPQLEEHEYQFINDITYYFQKRQTQGKKYKIFLQFYNNIHFKIPLPVFMPTNMFRVCWDIFQVIYTYLFLYFYSILMFFAQDERDSAFIQMIFKYTFFIFLIDGFVNFNTAYFDKDIIVVNRKKICKKVILSNFFLTDSISLLIMGYKVIFQSIHLVYNPENNLTTYGINLLIFLKLNGVFLKRNRFDYVFTLKESQKHIFRLLNQLFSVIFIAHIASLGWYCIGLYETQNEYTVSWLLKANLDEAKYYEKYIFSLYWSITTMTTVGYGDISATNYVEAIFISINMIIFSCVFAYSINNIGFILQEIQKSSKQLNENISTMQRYLNSKEVDLSLQCRVRHYLSFLAEEQKNKDQKSGNDILGILSNKLRNEITIEINQRILTKYNIFSANFSAQTLRKLIFLMQEVLISPNEIIFEQGNVDDSSIYFIEGGIIEIYELPINTENSNNINSRANVIKTLKQNELFGDISFFSGMARMASARSVNLSTLYKINRNQFIDILQENIEDFQRFKMMEEQIKIQNDLSSIFIECYVCRKHGHTASKCPNTHLILDHQFYILKSNFSLFQDRISYTSRRNILFKFNSRYIFKCSQLSSFIKTYKKQIIQ